MIYVLPTDDPAVVKKFEQLFTVLDRYMAKLKIKSYGLSDTTLEEVGRIQIFVQKSAEKQLNSSQWMAPTKFEGVE